jgi:hypothetical protein
LNLVYYTTLSDAYIFQFSNVLKRKRGGNVTDHLEPYRRMARSIRFIPPLALNQPSQKSASQPETPAPVGQSSSWSTTSWSAAKPVEGPPIDLSEHAAALVQEAVSKPTVLPVTYSIQENIGDRISRLVPAKPVESTVIQFKIPQPDPNWTPANGNSATESGIDPSEHVAALVQEAVSQPTVLPKSYTIPENIGDRISRLGTSQPEAPTAENPSEPEVKETQTQQQRKETPASAPAVVAPETPDVEETPEPEISKTELKKSLDDTHLEVSDSVVSESPAVEEVSSGDTVGGVVESSQIVERANDEAASALVAEPTVEETANVEATAVVEESVEDSHTPNLVERVSLAVEAAVTAFQHPNSDRAGSEANQEPDKPQASAANTVESSVTESSVEHPKQTHSPTLVERVSAAVEAATTAFQDPEPDENSSEPQQELARSEVTLEPTRAELEKATDAETDKPQQTANSPVEASKVKASEVSTVSSTSTSESSKRRGKKKTKAKGFGGSKGK